MEVHQIITGALNAGESAFAVGSVEGINFTACAVGCDVVILASELQRVQIIPGTSHGNVQVSCVDCCSETGKIAAAYHDTVRIFEPRAVPQQFTTHKLDYRWIQTSEFCVERVVTNLSWNLEGLRLLVSTDSQLQMWQHRWLAQQMTQETFGGPVASEGVKFGIPDDGGDGESLGGGQDGYGGDADGAKMGDLSGEAGQKWKCYWRNTLSDPIKFLKFSPDGLLFATSGPDDNTVKIWYEEKLESTSARLLFSFIYLSHPLPVSGFEWRRTGRYMPRYSVGNVLITWCRDHICRIWNETAQPDSGLTMGDAYVGYSSSSTGADNPAPYNLGPGLNESVASLTQPGGSGMASGVPTGRKHTKHSLKSGRHKFAHRLKHLTHLSHSQQKHKESAASHSDVVADDQSVDQLSVGGLASTGDSMFPNMMPSQSVVWQPGDDYSDSFELPTFCHFHLATCISAETDCYLVPSMTRSSSNAEEDDCFAVHWLNNKELMFSLSSEKLLAEALLAAEQRNLFYDAGPVGDPHLASGNHHRANADAMSTGSGGLDSNSDGEMGKKDGRSPELQPQSLSLEEQGDGATVTSRDTLESGAGSTTIPTMFSPSLQSDNLSMPHQDSLDYQMEALIRAWHRSADVLFTIHPVDGSLLVWTVDFLDDLSRQPQVSFSSRLPYAFPLTDAGSLQQNLVTFNPHDPAFVLVQQRFHSDKDGTVNIPDQPQNTIFLLTSHVNGSLNLWHLSVDESSEFSTIMSIAHRSRMCGHRFRINSISCHPVLPLLLTSSFHNIKKSDKLCAVPTIKENGAMEFSYFNSELILWKVNPVGPLCKSGGIQELARINSSAFSAFSTVAWIPAILPSSTFGAVCNSPSSCFVASDGERLRVYQAVIDARALIAEVNFAKKRQLQSQSSTLSESSLSSSSPLSPGRGMAGFSIADSLNIVSTQSTARPGCVIDLGAVDDAEESDFHNLILLHIFQESLIIGDQILDNPPPSPRANPRGPGTAVPSRPNPNGHFHQDSVRDMSKSCCFLERFFLVLVTKGQKESSHGKAAGGVDGPATESRIHMWLIELVSQPQLSAGGGSWTGENGFPADLGKELVGDMHSEHASKLQIRSRKVCDQLLAMPEKVRVLDAKPTAGHLSSSSIYPACMAPYLLVTACSDDKVRFWQCNVTLDGREHNYEWVEWHMMELCGDSSLDLDGKALGLSCAYSGRFACVVDPSNTFDTRKHDIVNVQVAVYECESSGGNGWVMEDLIHLRNIRIPRAVLMPLDTDYSIHSPVDDLMQEFQMLPDGLPRSASGANLLKRIPSYSLLAHQSSHTTDMRKAVEQHNWRVEHETPQKQMVRLDWVSTEDGTHILTVGVGSKIFLYAPVSEDLAQQNVTMMKESESKKKPLLRQASSIAAIHIKRLVKWVSLRTIELHSFDGRPPLPMMLGWVRDGILVVGMESEMRIYSQWNPVHDLVEIFGKGGQGVHHVDEEKVVVGHKTPFKIASGKRDRAHSEGLTSVRTIPSHLLAATHPIQLAISPSHSVLDLSKKGGRGSESGSATRTVPHSRKNSQDGVAWKTARDQTGGTGSESGAAASMRGNVVDIVRDEGLFQAAKMATPMLPQYHPKQLMELLNAGRIQRVRTILMHVLQCVHDQMVSRQTSMRRPAAQPAEEGLRSRCLSRAKSDAGNPLLAEDLPLDYLEIEFIPPLPLYALLSCDSESMSSPSAGFGANSAAGRRESQQPQAVNAGVPHGVDNDSGVSVGGAQGPHGSDHYDGLFGTATLVDSDLELDFEENLESSGRRGSMRSRKSVDFSSKNPSTFGSKHTEMLSRLLTHTHLPGLSSVDQMHLLAVADTISSFSSDVFDKLAQANAEYKTTPKSVIEATFGSGYANVGTGIEAVDDCGLRYLMALRQHEYLLKCLPMGQRARLMQKGLATCHMIWAFHSETETELLNCISSLQNKSSWADLRAVGAGWWLTSTPMLKLCIEKAAKTAFQTNNDPLDAAIFYIAMKRKNVLWGLFRSVKDTKMTEFFSHDFAEDKWKKAALKNAFVLMGKQRFEHAAAFFLLGNALDDAIRVCINNLNDLQLALVIVKLFETDLAQQNDIVTKLLCKQVFGCTVEETSHAISVCDNTELHPGASRDPFLRSMAFWIMKEYHQALLTLLVDSSSIEGGKDDPAESASRDNYLVSDVFNFYHFLRMHPLVIRHRLADFGFTVSSTEQFLQVARTFDKRIAPAERSLFFKTAVTHFRSGCALLALDILSKLPRLAVISTSPSTVLRKLNDSAGSGKSTTLGRPGGGLPVPNIVCSSPSESELESKQEPNDGKFDVSTPVGPQKAADCDWGTPLINGFSGGAGTGAVNGSGGGAAVDLDWGISFIAGGESGLKKSNKPEDKLELVWSDEEEEEEENVGVPDGGTGDAKGVVNPISSGIKDSVDRFKAGENPKLSTPRISMDEGLMDNEEKRVDIMAQQLKFIACLKILMEELATLAGGYEVEGGQLRYQLYFWLEKEVQVLQTYCDYQSSADEEVFVESDSMDVDGVPLENGDIYVPSHNALLHEAVRSDHADLHARVGRTRRRRRWLARHHPLLRTMAAYCSLHGEGNIGLSSARMELLLLLQELHQEQIPWRQMAAPIPLQSSFPLLSASLASFKTDLADPIRTLKLQTDDLLQCVSEMRDLPKTEETLSKVYLLYNLAQCLSACIYESLCDIENFDPPKGAVISGHGFLLRQRLKSSCSSAVEEDPEITTLPSKWPGVQTLLTLLSTEREDDSLNLRTLLAEAWCAIYLALFAYAFVAYDSRWLYRLVAHKVDDRMFGTVFGGGGERRMVVEAGGGKLAPPARPPVPPAAGQSRHGSDRFDPDDKAGSSRSMSPMSLDGITGNLDPSKLRAKFHAKVFGPQGPSSGSRDASGRASPATPGERKGSITGSRQHRVSTKEVWVQPKRSTVSYFTAKPVTSQDLGLNYDSDDSLSDVSEEEEELSFADSGTGLGTGTLGGEVEQAHLDPNSYQWLILRLVTVEAVLENINKFLNVCGYDEHELASASPLVHRCLRTLQSWSHQLSQALNHYPGGCPLDLLPGGDVGTTNGPALQRYRSLLEPNNTPFRTKDKAALPVKRLWLFLVRQENLTEMFIRHIFCHRASEYKEGTIYEDSDGRQVLPEPVKIMHREQDPITCFSISQGNPGWIVVGTNREIQEMDVSVALRGDTRWMRDQVEIDLGLNAMKKNPLQDNDDYMVLEVEKGELGKEETTVLGGRSTSFASVERLAQYKPDSFLHEPSPATVIKMPYLCKREVSGVKRMEGHPTLPYYLSGSTDGSVKMWEFGVAQPLYAPRSAGQFAKTTRVRFSPHGNKFGVSDGDGSLCFWQVSHGMTLRKPYMSLKCHSKITADFVFINSSSSLVASAGHSTGDHNVALWDLLIPSEKALVHSWQCHPDGGATSLLWVPQQLSIYSGGKHGEVCIFDARQRLCRQTFKVFDHCPVKCLALDPNGEFFVAGSTEGDIKVWSLGHPQLLYSFPHEHAGKADRFSFRNVGVGAVQGVAQLYVDNQRHLFSCGADASLKIRILPPGGFSTASVSSGTAMGNHIPMSSL